MTPIWIFPACPLLIIGPHAGVLSEMLKPSQALDIIIGGYTEHWIHGLNDDLLGFHLPSYDAKVTTREHQTRHGRLCRPKRLHGNWCALPRAMPKDFMGDGMLAAMIPRVTAN